MRRIVSEGFVAGLIGAAGAALWFLIIDATNGRPFFTPATLGSALFWSVTDPAQVDVAFPTLVGYTMVHVLAFVVVGIIATALAYEVQVLPSTAFIALAFFAIFEFGFYVIMAVLGQPLLGPLTWWNVAIGNAAAAVGMGYYLWRIHPKLRAELATHPLGEPVGKATGTSADGHKEPS